MNTTTTHHEPEDGLMELPVVADLPAGDLPVAQSDRELDVDSAFRQTRSGSATLHGERQGVGNTPAEHSWDDGGQTRIADDHSNDP